MLMRSLASLFEGEQSTRVFEGPCAFLGEL